MTDGSQSPLTPDYTLAEVAAALRMSTRWVRERIKEGAEHQRNGHKITFTAAQVDKLRAGQTRSPLPVAQSITTGKKKAS